MIITVVVIDLLMEVIIKERREGLPSKVLYADDLTLMAESEKIVNWKLKG